MTADAGLRAYLTQHFVSLAELARLTAVSQPEVVALIESGAIPGPIYSIWPNGSFCSPIGGQHGPTPQGTPEHWYSPAAAWWIRRGRGLSPADAAASFAAKFTADFIARLPAEPDGMLGYPQAFPKGQFNRNAAEAAAAAEWQDWLDGGYGVCLRHADARHAITKTCRRATVLAITDEGRASSLTDAQRDSLLTALEELDAVMLPFAPHQRPYGTPGLWLDAILLRYGLGTTRHAASPVASVPDRFCA